MRVVDRARIGETDRLAVVADADVVLAVSRKSVGGGAEGGRDSVATYIAALSLRRSLKSLIWFRLAQSEKGSKPSLKSL